MGTLLPPKPVARPKLIGLYSPIPQMGKSTVARHLAIKYGARHSQFAEPLKECAARVIAAHTGYTIERAMALFNSAAKDEPMYLPGNGWGASTWTPRDILKVIGENMRKVNATWWLPPVQRIIDEANRKDLPGTSVIIDDVRKENERDLILRNGGVMWAVIDPSPKGAERINRMDTRHDGIMGVTLEELRSLFPFVLVNDRSKGDDYLIRQADAAWAMTQRVPL